MRRVVSGTGRALLGVMLNKTDDRKGRIVARRLELLTKLGELKADVSQEAASARDKLRARLFLLDRTIKIGIKGGWDTLNDAVKLRLTDWVGK